MMLAGKFAANIHTEMFTDNFYLTWQIYQTKKLIISR